MDPEFFTAAVTWGLNLIFGLLLAIVGFFVKQLVADQRKRGEQLEGLAQRVVILEERERGLAAQIEELKLSVDSLCGDVRFVREKIILLVGRQGFDEDGHSGR